MRASNRYEGLRASKGVLSVADTNFIKTEVEPFVREQLSQAYNRVFKAEATKLKLTTNGEHEFDAVSQDGAVVASIKSHSGKTKSGRIASGGVLACIAELYYLSLLEAEQRILVLTDEAMYSHLTKSIVEKQRLAPGVRIEFIRLSEQLQERMASFKPLAQAEVSPLLPAEELA